MFLITLVSCALRVTALLKTASQDQSDLALESDIRPQSEDNDQRDLAIIFVSRTSGARLGEKLLEEYDLENAKFQKKNLHLYDIQEERSRTEGLNHACRSLTKDSNLIVAAAGGDGTVSWVVSLLATYKDTSGKECFLSSGLSESKELNDHIFIRHIGFGTGNDFAKSSGYTNEFNLLGEYKKKKDTWLGTLENLNVGRDGDSPKHTMWEASIIANNITTVSKKGIEKVRDVRDITVEGNKMQNVTEYALLYLSGPFSGLMPCKVEQHRAESGNFMSAANKNRLLYAEYGVKALFKTSPSLNTYLTFTELDTANTQISFPKRSHEFLLLVGKTFGGGKTPSLTKKLGDSAIQVLVADGMRDLATMKFTKIRDTEKAFRLDFKSSQWENEAKGFESKLDKKEKKVYTIQKDGECRRLHGLKSIDMKPFIRFNVLKYK